MSFGDNYHLNVVYVWLFTRLPLIWSHMFEITHKIALSMPWCAKKLLGSS